MHRVVAVVLPRVVAFDLAVAAQVFGHPDERGRYSFGTCSIRPGVVPSTTGFGVTVRRGLDALEVADTVVTVGFAPHTPAAGEVLYALRAAAARGARLLSICTGAFALAAAGLLDGRHATTHWRDATELARRYPNVRVDTDVLYVVDGPVMTSAGLAAGIDLCIHVVRCDYGEQIAAEVARRMVVAPHRDGGRPQLLARPVPAADDSLSSTCAWALQHIGEPLSIAELARHAGWAPRTFTRRFLAEMGTSPRRWLIAQRLLEARRLLEQTAMTVDQVARRAGLGTAANLRLHLIRDSGTTPTVLRREHRQRTGGERKPVR